MFFFCTISRMTFYITCWLDCSRTGNDVSYFWDGEEEVWEELAFKRIMAGAKCLSRHEKA